MSVLLAWLAASCAAVPSTPAEPGAPADNALAIPSASVDDSLEVVGESVEARQIRTRMTVGVTVNGQGPFRFMVDSGADRSVVGAALARRLALPPARSVTLHDMAGSRCVDTVRVEQLRVGGSETKALSVPALSEAHLGAQGLLGIDALAGQRLMFDFDARTITFQNTRRALRAAGPDEIVVIARRRKGQLIITEVKVGRHELYAVVDSGSELTIGNTALRTALFSRRRKPPPSFSATLTTVTGQPVQADMVVMPELLVGGLRLSNVTVAFADVPPFARFGLADRPAIFLGTDVLQLFKRVSLDFRNRKIRFLLRR